MRFRWFVRVLLEKKDKKNSNLDEAIENAVEIKQSVPVLMRKNLKDNELKAMEEEDLRIWWYCDEC